MTTTLRAWGIVIGVVLAFILVPFLLAGERFDAATTGLLAAGHSPPLLATLTAVLLTLDVLLPIPSSVVAVAAGHELGFAVGAFAVFVGLQAGCVSGWILGRASGRRGMRKALGAEPYARAGHALDRRSGWLAFGLGRAVPVLAEASVLLAGAADVPLRRFLLASTLANLGVALAYSGMGAWSAATGSPGPAVLGAVLLPGLAMVLAPPLLAARRSAHPPSREVPS